MGSDLPPSANMTIEISSLQNQRIKDVVKLNNRRQRDAQQQTVVEGVREVGRALAAGTIPVEAYVCPPLLSGPDSQPLVERLRSLHENGRMQLCMVTPPVYAKIAYRGRSGGLLLVIPYLGRRLEDFPLGRPPFLVVVEGAEKPGNLGAILRTADAAGVDGLVLCDGGTDLHNPNVIRASLGTIFTVPLAEAPTAEVIDWLKAHHIHILAATPDATTLYTDVDATIPVAIVTGSEAYGLSDSWLAAADQQVIIPMYGQADSLNLATSTALLLYEVVRQRCIPPSQ